MSGQRCLSLVSDHQHSPADEWRIREAALDETIAGSFPASDPPSSIPNPDDHDAAIETPTPGDKECSAFGAGEHVNVF